jgi:HKD family nuclease
MPVYKDLEARGAFVFFRKMLHAKLYLFEINKYKLNWHNRDFDKTAIIGSSNMTREGWGFDNAPSNEEVCYKLPTSTYEEAKAIAESLISDAEDYTAHVLRKVRT